MTTKIFDKENYKHIRTIHLKKKKLKSDPATQELKKVTN